MIKIRTSEIATECLAIEQLSVVDKLVVLEIYNFQSGRTEEYLLPGKLIAITNLEC